MFPIRPVFTRSSIVGGRAPPTTPFPKSGLRIRLIAQRRYSDAYMINWQSNVFPGILGRTCDRPCEPACRRSRVGERMGAVPEPVAICRLKRVAADMKDDMQKRRSFTLSLHSATSAARSPTALRFQRMQRISNKCIAFPTNATRKTDRKCSPVSMLGAISFRENCWAINQLLPRSFI
jgi:Dihydroprymidine dehydrogenase domain II, 4Fe-4S cluster